RAAALPHRRLLGAEGRDGQGGAGGARAAAREGRAFVNLGAALELARVGRLYPSVILHGATLAERVAAAQQVARTLLCTAEEAARPCGACRNCRRIDFAPDAEVFHPDVVLLRRDLKTSTSVEAT